MRLKKTCLRGADKVLHKPGCTATEDKRLEILDFSRIVAKTKVLISCAVNAQLICILILA